VARLRTFAPSAEVLYRDLAAAPVPHFSIGSGTDQDAETLKRVLDEVIESDVIVIGAPMYNFSVPSQLKAWLDALVVPGRTFNYSEAGVEGLLGNKRVVIASSRGGVYAADSAASALDHQEPLLRGLLGFLGITQIEIVRAEGEGTATTAITAALEHAGRLELEAA
jgi:FMN-dependent NADH-azoreductase